MHSRLKELAIEANLIASEPNGFDPTRLSIAQQKFAELIVRECVGIADEYDGVGSTIVSRIKEHFGVEE